MWPCKTSENFLYIFKAALRAAPSLSAGPFAPAAALPARAGGNYKHLLDVTNPSILDVANTGVLVLR